MVIVLCGCLGCLTTYYFREGDYEKITTNWYGFIEEREAENTDEMISFYSKDGINLLPRVVQRVGRTNFAKLNNV